MALTTFDGSFSYKQEELAKMGGMDRGTMSEVEWEKFQDSPFMKSMRKLEEAAAIKYAERDERRTARDPEFKPSDLDFEQPPAFQFDKDTNYYKALGVDENATQATVKLAYTKLSLVYHPDKTAGLNQKEKDEYKGIFQEIKNAYKTLGDVPTRRQYDRLRDRDVAGFEVNGWKLKQKANTFDATEVLKKIQIDSKAPGKTVDVPIACRLEKFVWGGFKVIERERKVADFDGFTTETRAFRLEVAKGAGESCTAEFMHMGDDQETTRPDSLRFVFTSKPHNDIERQGDDMLLKANVRMNPDAHAQPYISGQTGTIRGRHVVFWGRNPFFRSTGSGGGELRFRIRGEGVSPQGTLHFTAQLGPSDSEGKNVVVRLKQINTGGEMALRVPRSATILDIRTKAYELLDFAGSQSVKVMRATQGGHAPYPDDQPIGSLRSFDVAGSSWESVPIDDAKAILILQAVAGLTDTPAFHTGLEKAYKLTSANRTQASVEVKAVWNQVCEFLPDFGFDSSIEMLKDAIKRSKDEVARDPRVKCVVAHIDELVIGFDPDAYAKKRKVGRAPKGLALHPIMTRRREREVGGAPVCEVEMEPIFPLGEGVDLATKPACHLVFYSNLRQAAQTPLGQLRPRPMFAVCISCARGSKKAGLSEWGEMKEELGQTIADSLFLLFQPSRGILPKPLLATAAFPDEAYNVDEDVTVTIGAEIEDDADDDDETEEEEEEEEEDEVEEEAQDEDDDDGGGGGMFDFDDMEETAEKKKKQAEAREEKRRQKESRKAARKQLKREQRAEEKRRAREAAAAAEDDDDEEEEPENQGADEEEEDGGGGGMFDFDDMEETAEKKKKQAEEREEQLRQKEARKAAKQRELREKKAEERRRIAAEKAAANPDKIDSANVAVPWKRLGDQALKYGDHFLGIDYYSKQLAGERKADEEEATVLANRSACLAETGFFEEAYGDAKAAADIRKDWGQAWKRAGLAASNLGPDFHDQARDAYFNAVQHEPTVEHVQIFSTLAKALPNKDIGRAEEERKKGNDAMKEQQWGLAISLYTLAIALVPEEGGTEDTKKDDDAKKVLRSILLGNRSLAFAQLLNYDAAVSDGRLAVEASASNAMARYRLGTAFLGCRQYELAYCEFAQAVKLESDKGIFLKAQNACLALMPLWCSAPAKLRSRRFGTDLGREKGAKVFAMSDIFFDLKGSEKWVGNVDSIKFQNDILIVAGNAACPLTSIMSCLSLLKSKFHRVFFTPGNQDVWIHPTEVSRFPDSLSKFHGILAACDQIGVDVFPAAIAEDVFIIPLFSWYNPEFDEKDPFPDPNVPFDARCKWPMDENTVWRFMLDLNKAHLKLPYKGTIITFSHFLPRDFLPYDKFVPKLGKVTGCLELNDQIQELGCKFHIYGHSRKRGSKEEQNTTYLQHSLGTENEHSDVERLMCVFNGTSTCSRTVHITAGQD